MSLLRDVLYKHLENIWAKTSSRTNLTLCEKLFFHTLCFFQLFYRVLFYVINFYKRALAYNKRSSFFYVISVGNLSVGGTGKSVFVEFLVKTLGKKSCAIALRGYKSNLEKSKKSFIVSDGNTLFYDATEAGDEAYMFAQNLKIPVVIGPNRAQSCEVLENLYKNIGVHEKSYLILDDAYQHHTLQKNLEILLLDARHPFENNHCLPAGRLREKDYSRADIIILTHADCVDTQTLDRIKQEKLGKFDQTKIFLGKHVTQEIYYHNDSYKSLEKFDSLQVLVFAGIGSFGNFVNTIKQSGVTISQTLEYQDHHAYTKQDLENIKNILKTQKLDFAITTSKDWCKLEPIIKKYDIQISVYVLRIGFEFLSPHEYDDFNKVLASK